MSENRDQHKPQRFVFLGLDPVHIGTGGYRLGRVDNSIVKEPGTDLPKIPGTSIAGTARSYAARRYGKPEAAGQHKNFPGNRDKCPIIQTFGTATEGEGRAGKIRAGDAQLLLFPVSSREGPVWVSTKEILEEAGFVVDSKSSEKEALTSLELENHRLNLGWLLFDVENGLKVKPPDDLSSKPEWSKIASRIVLVSQKMFSQIVNSNLEVRTSVAINPETGAAEDKALYTYEALPRGTWLWFDVVEDDYEGGFLEITRSFNRDSGQENNGEPLGDTWSRPLDVLKAGFQLIEYLGVGGMGTRGFGRMKMVADWNVS